MGDLSTYSLVDFFPISKPVYLRLFVRHNEAIWPGQLLALVAVCAAVVALLRGRSRWAGGLLGACWVFVGLSFLLRFYAELNWAATYAGWLFVVQGLALGGAGFAGRLGASEPTPLHASKSIGVGLAAAGVVALPVVGLLSGRSWSGLPVAGAAPDPTVVATLGALAATARPPWWLSVVPLIWCGAAAATGIVFETPTELASAGLGLAAVGLVVWRHVSPSEFA